MKVFLRVSSIDYEYGYLNCTDTCGNLFRIISKEELDPTWIGKKISIDGQLPAIVVKEIKLEPRLR